MKHTDLKVGQIKKQEIKKKVIFLYNTTSLRLHYSGRSLEKVLLIMFFVWKQQNRLECFHRFFSEQNLVNLFLADHSPMKPFLASSIVNRLVIFSSSVSWKHANPRWVQFERPWYQQRFSFHPINQLLTQRPRLLEYDSTYNSGAKVRTWTERPRNQWDLMIKL